MSLKSTEGIRYNSTVWNLSQNVDRTIGSNKLGICPCLTPSMIPYITNRGGPMVGLEALSMQGLPVDKLLLTRETEDQLADLAGNAMSTTVVGTCILAAFVIAKTLLKDGGDSVTYETKRGTDWNQDEGDAMDVDRIEEDVLPIEERVVEDQLIKAPLNLSTTNVSSLTDLLADAEKSARLCSCEGRTDMTSRELVRCIDCGNSSCKKCGGRPEHNVQGWDIVANPRLAPLDFAKKLKSTLPMCISLSNVTQALLDGLKDSANLSIPVSRWKAWSSTVLRAAQPVLRFVDLKRQEIWSAVYQSPTAILEFILHPQRPEWRLYALVEEHESANAEIRKIVESPVGRLVCVDGLLSGSWEFALPHVTSIPVTIKGVGDLVPSWQARLGLMEKDYKDKQVYSRLQVTVPDNDVAKFDRDISGVYTLLDRCGTANGALHKREAQDENLPPIFLLFDPFRTTDEVDDSFVFSTSIRRYEFGESRPVIARLAPSWRQSDAKEVTVDCRLSVHWITADSVLLQVRSRIVIIIPSLTVFSLLAI